MQINILIYTTNIFTDRFKYIKIYLNPFKWMRYIYFLKISSSQPAYKGIQIYTNVYKCIQIYTKRLNTVQLYTFVYIPIQVYKCIVSVQKYTNVYKCIQLYGYSIQM